GRAGARLWTWERGEVRRRTRLAWHIASVGLCHDLAVTCNDLAALDGCHGPTAQPLALERREVRHSLQVFGAHDAFLFEVDDHQICIRANRDGALPRVNAVDKGRTAGRALTHDVERHAAH